MINIRIVKIVRFERMLRISRIFSFSFFLLTVIFDSLQVWKTTKRSNHYFVELFCVTISHKESTILVLSSGSNWLGSIFICWSRMIVVAGVINFWSNLPLLAWKSYMTMLLPCRSCSTTVVQLVLNFKQMFKYSNP